MSVDRCDGQGFLLSRANGDVEHTCLTVGNEREHPFMAFADYDIALYGYYDFFDAVQMFVSNGVLGLGIGNVDRNYPFFGIPTMKLVQESVSDEI